MSNQFLFGCPHFPFLEDAVRVKGLENRVIVKDVAEIAGEEYGIL